MKYNKMRLKKDVFPSPGNVRYDDRHKLTISRRVFSILFSLLVFSLNAVAENTLKLSSQEQGWSIQLSAPTLVNESIFSSADYFRYTANSGDGFFISLHVKPLFAEVISPVACRDRYHKSSDNLPTIIDKASITFIENTMPEVHYNANIVFKEQTLSMPNSHYYFVINGYCADLHMGASPVYDDTHSKPYHSLAKSIKNSLKMESPHLTAMEATGR